MKRITGYYLPSSRAGGESYKAFIPAPLPPNPSLNLDNKHMALLEKANLALGRLDGLGYLLPSTHLFIYFYIRKEALLSSQIEGIQSSLDDLLMYENREDFSYSIDDVVEVSNYVAAMEYGLKRLRVDQFPLSLRLLKEIHGVLLKDGRGSEKTPGKFRKSQNWVGGTRPGNALYVPPPPDQVMACMGNLEKFLHDQPVSMPVLIKAALAHVHFETIHPFLDGNGRLGRLLITFLLCAEGALSEPMLYLSLYFKTHRDAYYNWLQRVRKEGDWEGWLSFFLQGVIETATQATESARSILALFESDRSRIETLGRSANSTLRVFHLFKQYPILSLSTASTHIDISFPTISKAVEHLSELGIISEITGKQRGKIFVYQKYLDIIGQGTEPL